MNPQLFCRIDATKILPNEGHECGWPPSGVEASYERRLTFIKMEENVKAKVQGLLES